MSRLLSTLVALALLSPLASADDKIPAACLKKFDAEFARASSQFGVKLGTTKAPTLNLRESTFSDNGSLAQKTFTLPYPQNKQSNDELDYIAELLPNLKGSGASKRKAVSELLEECKQTHRPDLFHINVFPQRSDEIILSFGGCLADKNKKVVGEMLEFDPSTPNCDFKHASRQYNDAYWGNLYPEQPWTIIMVDGAHCPPPKPVMPYDPNFQTKDWVVGNANRACEGARGPCVFGEYLDNGYNHWVESCKDFKKELVDSLSERLDPGSTTHLHQSTPIAPRGSDVH